MTKGIFLIHPKFAHGIARQDYKCERETVTFNSSFIEFMLAFLGIDQSRCACDDVPCPSASKYVKLYIYRTYVRYIHSISILIVKLMDFGSFLSFFPLPEQTVIRIVFKDYTRMVRMHI